MRGSRPRIGILAACAVMMTGCSHSPRTRTFTIGFVPPPSRPTLVGPSATVRVVSMRLPASFDRVEVVSQSSPDELTVDDFAHWGAPVEVLAREALSRDLAARLPIGAVAYGVRPTSAALELHVEVVSFEMQNGRAVMRAKWSVSVPRVSPLGEDRVLDLSVPVEGTGSAATAVALSDLTAKIADDVAANPGSR